MMLQELMTTLSVQWAFTLFGFDVVFRLDYFILLLAGAMLYRATRCGRQQVILYSPIAFADFGFRMIGAKTRGSTMARTRRFKAHFGCEPAIASQIWRELYLSGWLKNAGVRPNPDHLLFALVFLRSYNKVSATLCNTNERNFLRWSWFYAEGIANLDKKCARKTCFSHFWVSGPCLANKIQ